MILIFLFVVSEMPNGQKMGLNLRRYIWVGNFKVKRKVGEDMVRNCPGGEVK